jgi:hypothetical protein
MAEINPIGADINKHNYYIGKILTDFSSLSNKLVFAINYLKNIMENQLKYYLYTNNQMSQNDYQKVFVLICTVHDDIMVTLKTERIAIDGYVIDGFVNEDDYKHCNEYLTYIEKRNEYFNNNDKVIKMWLSSSHHERFPILTEKMADQCSICLKKHGKSCAVTLSCNHTFGKKCFNKWIDTCIEINKQQVTCPHCRKLHI